MKLFLFFISFLIPAISFSQCQPACSVTLGNNCSASTTFGSPTVAIYAVQDTFPFPGPSYSCNTITFYANAGSDNASVYLWDSFTTGPNFNNPNNLLATGSIVIPTGGRWYSVSIPAVNLVAGQSYWFGVQFQSGVTPYFASGSCNQIPNNPYGTNPGNAPSFTGVGGVEPIIFGDVCSYTSTPTSTPTNSPTPTPTSTPANTPTNTFTPSPPKCHPIFDMSFYSAPPTQTPAPNVNTVYAQFGDSYTLGTDADPHGFTYYVGVTLNGWYPTTESAFTNYGIGGATSAFYATTITGIVNNIPGLGYGPMARATVELGLNNLARAYGSVDSFGVTCFSCCYGATDAQSITYSYTYQSEIQSILNAIYSGNPSTLVVLMTPSDPCNNGEGPDTCFADQVQFQAYGTRLKELAASETISGHSCVVADVYANLLGCTSCYNTTIPDPLHPSEYGYQRIANVVIPQFANGG